VRIVLCYPAEAQHIAQIQAIVPEAEIVDAGQEHVAEELPEADIFFGHAKVPVPWEEVVRRGRVRWIQSSAAGIDHCLVPCVAASPIVVTSLSGVLADQVAEHGIGLITALCRSFPVFWRAQAKREFIRRPTRDLHHSTVGIVGLGGVGRRLAELLAPFRTRILATDYCPVDKPAHVAALWPPDHLPRLAAEVDILVLCAPLNDQTRCMIDRTIFERMKPGAFFVNIGRGQLVVEPDLVQALRSGHLAGAALDVTFEEPLPVDSPLWELPNVIITPHVGGQSARRIDDTTNFFCENLRRYLRGEPLLNLVDKKLGFPLRAASHQWRVEDQDSSF
jgi:D-3-phosphoglycerate dehydrogenase